MGLPDVIGAADRWRRFAPVLAHLFPNDIPDGVIESELLPIPRITARYRSSAAPGDLASRVLVKADHALSVAGSIKARGGIYEVLCVAERIALAAGLLREGRDDYLKLVGPEARRLFGGCQLLVASTGNLGFAVGVAARAFGFETIVHMSREAKAWKKRRLGRLGAIVVEHEGDYTSAVAAARVAATRRAQAHFVDDERSMDLFLGYSTAALHLVDQLCALRIDVDERHPLVVYLPCGVGGAPGGVFFGLRALLGGNVHGILAEPTSSPCMLMRLIGEPATSSVYDIGLDNRTVADGLAVARASDLVYGLVGPALTGAYTVSDDELLTWVSHAHREEGLRLEPAAAAGLPGALRCVWDYPAAEDLRDTVARATHVIWTTGGSLLPDEEFQALLARGAPPDSG